MAETPYALSVKQPWALLLVRGLKRIEVRGWPTARRGPILIHAARIPDTSPWAWEQVPAELQSEAKQVGGIIGAALLSDCVAYRSQVEFARDQEQHLNDPTWFREPALYGFAFVNPTVLPFRAYPGWLRFFPVEEQLPTRKKRSAQSVPPSKLAPEAESAE